MSATEAGPDAKPSRSGRLLALVRALIAYGRQMAATLRDNHPTLSAADIGLVIRRIARGLLLAEALEARIIREAPRLDAEPKPRPVPAQRTAPDRARQCAARAPRPADTTEAVLAALANLPTADEIAADVRRRPIGAVIADICRDIGIMPSNRLWPEIRHLITIYRGNLARLVKDSLDQLFQTHPALAWPSTPLPASAVPSPAPSGIGPPRSSG